MRKTISIIALMLMVLITFSCKKEGDKMIVNGTETFKSEELFSNRDKETTTNLIYKNKSIIIEDNSKRAIYQSKAIEMERFSELVLSYNVEDLEDGSLAFLVAVGDGTDFGDFYTMAIAMTDNNRSSSTNGDDYGKVSIDTLINKDINNNYIILRAVFNPGKNIKLKNITITSVRENSSLSFDESKLINKTLAVTPISQLDIPNIGNIICSPTSVTMVLDYYGYQFSPEDVAKKVKDVSANIYGNWTFNASYPGSFSDLISYVEYIDNFDKVVDYIKNDIPVIFSIKTTAITDLTGAIMSYPSGHLVVLIGFEKIDGSWYGIFNDPAEYSADKVLRKYSLEQVLTAWRQYTYIIIKK